MPSSPEINALNVQLRGSPAYEAWMRAQGINAALPIRLSDRQRREFARYLQGHGFPIPHGAEIDPAGNINEHEGFGTQAKKWGPLAAGAAVTAFGIPGVMPGMFGGGTTAATAAATRAGTDVAQKTGFFSTLGKFFAHPGTQAALNVGGPLVGAWMQNRGLNRGYDVQNAHNQQALDFLKSQDARDYAEYLKERDRGWRYQDEDRARAEEMRQLYLTREREREGRLTPFRAGAPRGYQTLSSLLFDPRASIPRSRSNKDYASLALVG